MLRTRILTALVLLALLLPTLFLAPPQVFAGVIGLFAAAGMWEWARLAGWRGAAALGWAGAWLLVAAAVLVAHELPQLRWVYGVATLAWLALLGSSLPRAALPRALALPAVLGLLGFVVLLAAWLALIEARRQGADCLLSVLMVAWVADVAAYFGGRAIGGPKLAPRVSPGKTRAGVYTAAVAVAGYALLCAWVPALHGTLPARVARAWGLLPMLLAAQGLLVLSVTGDLFESLLKRHAGVKDSSALLPGHGGVLDRVDALLPLLPVAAWMLLS